MHRGFYAVTLKIFYQFVTLQRLSRIWH